MSIGIECIRLDRSYQKRSKIEKDELPISNWFEQQKLDHFNLSNNATWKQVRILSRLQSNLKAVLWY
jgi:hypothetical protein